MGVDIVRVKARPANRDWYWAPGIAGAIRRSAPDVVHIQSYHTFVAPLAMVAARSLGAPFLLTFHGGGHSSAYRHRLRALQMRALGPFARRAAKLVATASFEIDAYAKLLNVPQDRFALVPNGGDVRGGRTDVVVDPSLIVSVGRLERYKGHHRVIAALPWLLERCPETRLEILGSGPYEEELRELAAELGVGNRVSLRSIPLERADEMATRLAEAAVVVLLSDFETHPMALLEAAAARRPVVVALTSGLRELVEQGIAVGVEPDAPPPAVGAMILNQMTDPMIPPAVSVPTWDECVDGLLEIYREVTRT
jgi:glycosyltransferase involved in cell wall biosynthesis